MMSNKINIFDCFFLFLLYKISALLLRAFVNFQDSLTFFKITITNTETNKSNKNLQQFKSLDFSQTYAVDIDTFIFIRG